MRRALDRWAIYFFWILVAIAYITMLTGCGYSPVAPNDEPHLKYNPAVSDARAAWSEAEWAFQANCLAFNRTQRSPLLVKVHPDAFVCGNVWANGCTNPGWLEVNEKTYEGALSHELIHWMQMGMGGPPDYKHESSVWKRCDHLNNPAAYVDFGGGF